MPPFDVCGPLPEGTVVLEASAGTGKTFTIAALATRYVAEGRAELGQLMLVTFGRAATQELRERVRERLVDTERGLADPIAARSATDDLLRLLADADDDEVALRRRRIAGALAGFDAATIATTHGFCQQMLAGLGMASDNDPDATFVEDLDDLIDEVVDDLYLRKYAAPGAGVPAMSYATARSVARDAVYDRQARLVPTDADPASEAGQRIGIARAARLEVERRKRNRKLLDYDDLLHRLRDALRDERHGEAARQRIRDRYKVVLVDEFQDTDPVQWDILRLTFAGNVTLVLIGDPKQAIYGFRGGDVVTYLDAAGTATSSATLTRNWRSDQPLVDALDELFGGAALGDERIVVRPVEAARPERTLTDGAPLRIRVLDRAAGKLFVDDARELVTADVAADIARRLGGGALNGDGLNKDGLGGKGLEPGDIAVLVRTNNQGRQIRDALAAVGVPAVLASNASVFGTPIARERL
ncbi:MAG: exodeoxyribonuclease beta subunit, partial [Frankiaceae bacterium]|nr:exodeoxyribonuclease beta subunit [Frankiaceae bacterium]